METLKQAKHCDYLPGSQPDNETRNTNNNDNDAETNIKKDNDNNHTLFLTTISSSGRGSRSHLTARYASSEGKLEGVRLDAVQADMKPILLSGLGPRATVCELQAQRRV